MKRNRTVILIAYCVLSPAVWAYLPSTHSKITSESIALLQNANPPLIELNNPSYSQFLGLGSSGEDDPERRGFAHFFNPVTIKGLNLTISGLGVTAPSATDTAFTHVLLLDGSSGSDRWDNAVTSYNNGSRSAAYNYLGEALHLLTQDMAQPYHVQAANGA